MREHIICRCKYSAIESTITLEARQRIRKQKSNAQSAASMRRLKPWIGLAMSLLGGAVGCGVNLPTTNAGGGTSQQLISLTCSRTAMTGAGSDACTVTLSQPAGTSGLAVSLSSDNSAVSVPGSVTVPAGSGSAGFTATASAVSAAQTATLTASAGGISKNVVISLGAAVPALTLDTTSVAFGSVTLSTPATQSVTLTSSGAAALIISTGAVTGSGFSVSGLGFPATLNPGQTATLYIQFDPTSAGTATGTVTLTSNASPSVATISVSGTGQTQTAAYQVQLTWNAPATSSDPVAGYDIYRALGTSSSYQILNSSINPPTSYTDTTVQNGNSYSYYVTSVDAQGNQSGPSNIFTLSIP